MSNAGKRPLLCRIGLHKPKYWFFLDGCKVECARDDCWKYLGFIEHNYYIGNKACGHSHD